MNFYTAFSYYYPEFLIVIVCLFIGIPVISLGATLANWYISGRFSLAKLKKEVKGKHILVTGGSKGLGFSICQELVKAGANLTLVARSIPSLESAVKVLSKLGNGRVLACPIDLTKKEIVKSKLEEVVRTHGSFDWVICNAGTALPGFLADDVKGEAQWMMECNYFSALNVVKSIIEISISTAELSKKEDEEKTMKGIESSDPDVLQSKNELHTISGISISAAKKMPTRIVFVGSVMSLLSFIGFSGYAARYFITHQVNTHFADSLTH